MSPLRELKSLVNRYDDESQDFDELKKYYFIFEGLSTEVKYFQGIQQNTKKLSINNMIKIIIFQKYGDIESHSNPVNLLEEAKIKKQELIKEEKFREGFDEFIVVFDRDSYKPVDKKRQQYLDFIDEAKDLVKLAVTSPCFEFWLLLHYEDSIQQIQNDYELFRQNTKVSKTHTFTSKRFSDLSGRNSKSNLRFEELVDRIDVAINQEKDELIKQDIYEMCDKLGSNIGKLIEKLRIDPREL